MLGGPGTGKSAIVSELVHTNPGGQVLACHCCQADTPVTVNAARFVRSIAGMLVSRLEGYAALLESQQMQQTLSENESANDPASAFEHGVLDALYKLPRPNGTRYLLIDALDERSRHRPTRLSGSCCANHAVTTLERSGQPVLAGQFEFLEWTGDNHLKHSKFVA